MSIGSSLGCGTELIISAELMKTFGVHMMFLCICVPWLNFQALLCCQNSFSSFSQASRPFRCMTQLTFTFALYQRKRNKGLDLSTPITISLKRAAEKWPSSQQSYQPLFNHGGKSERIHFPGCQRHNGTNCPFSVEEMTQHWFEWTLHFARHSFPFFLCRCIIVFFVHTLTE